MGEPVGDVPLQKLGADVHLLLNQLETFPVVADAGLDLLHLLLLLVDVLFQAGDVLLVALAARVEIVDGALDLFRIVPFEVLGKNRGGTAGRLRLQTGQLQTQGDEAGLYLLDVGAAGDALKLHQGLPLLHHVPLFHQDAADDAPLQVLHLLYLA